MHLVAHWLSSLDALLETLASDSHPSYRVFITGEPVQIPEKHIIPRGILENAIKITNEPPTGMNASLHAALNNFSQVCRIFILIFIFTSDVFLLALSEFRFFFPRTHWKSAAGSKSSTQFCSPFASSMPV